MAFCAAAFLIREHRLTVRDEAAAFRTAHTISKVAA
jgi:hypothetical protein